MLPNNWGSVPYLQNQAIDLSFNVDGKSGEFHSEDLNELLNKEHHFDANGVKLDFSPQLQNLSLWDTIKRWLEGNHSFSWQGNINGGPPNDFLQVLPSVSVQGGTGVVHYTPDPYLQELAISRGRDRRTPGRAGRVINTEKTEA